MLALHGEMASIDKGSVSESMMVAFELVDVGRSGRGEVGRERRELESKLAPKFWWTKVVTTS